MKKKSKRKKKKVKAAKKVAPRRRARVKPHRGPFQIELPLQMPLFPMEAVHAPAASHQPAELPPAPRSPSGHSQPSLLGPGLTS